MIPFRFDAERTRRTGIAEAVLCEGKTPAQLVTIAAAIQRDGVRLLFTRLWPEQFAALPADLQTAFDYDAISGTAILGHAPLATPPHPGVGIVAAGTSDLRVAREAARTLEFYNYAAPITADVGVAGLWRLTDQLETLRAHRIIIAVAGMEGALFSVLAGLVAAPVIAVPSSVGYGVAAGGRVALEVALSSCAPGVLAVNIDNGFGAAAAAVKMLRSLERK